MMDVVLLSAAELSSAMTTSEPLAVAAGKVEKLSKAERKEKKKQRKLKEQDVAASEPSTSDDTAVQLSLGSGFEEEKKKKKKDKKDKKKSAKADTADVGDGSVKRKADSQGMTCSLDCFCSPYQAALVQQNLVACASSACSHAQRLFRVSHLVCHQYNVKSLACMHPMQTWRAGRCLAGT
jgi:hypothetical protein